MKQICKFGQLGIALLAVIFIASCSKEDDVTVTRALIDEWSLTKLSLDNGDGVLDSAEMKDAFGLNGFEIATVNFGELGQGTYSPLAYYYSSTFGTGDFTWSTDDKMQAITVTKNTGERNTTKIIFQDYNHFALLELNGDFTYGQPVWNFFSRK